MKFSFSFQADWKARIYSAQKSSLIYVEATQWDIFSVPQVAYVTQKKSEVVAGNSTVWKNVRILLYVCNTAAWNF